MSRKTRSGRNFQNIDDNEDDEEENVYPSTSSGSHRYLSQDSREREMKKKSIVHSNRIGGRNALSQGSANLDLEPSRENTRNLEYGNLNEQQELDLAGRVIRYLFVMEKKKHVIPRIHIVKNILGGKTKNFRQIMEMVETLLSNVFGYNLVDIGGGKYILVNEIKNELPHLNFTQSIKAQQVLLFIILAHIFMCEESCGEESLWDFLRRLDIVKEDSFQHEYFGDVKQLITVDFISQHYLEKVTLSKGDNAKYEYKWGPRAEHEVTRRDVLEFMSKVYGGRPIKSWMQQYQTMLEKEKSERR